jgi:alpha-glucoside transport system permease protein
VEASALPSSRTGRGRERFVPLLFLAPALIFLLVWLVYPTVRTIVRSFFGRDGGDFVGFDNYKSLFTTDTLTTAIKNNVLWVAIVPAFVTAIGLIFAVLTERIRWSTAFKTVVFMPMAISLFAAGVIWRVMDQTDPSLGTVNATLKVVDDAYSSSGALTTAQASSPALVGSPSKGFVLRAVVRPGGVALMGLTAIPPEEVPADAPDAVRPVPRAGAIDGVVWRDFKPGGGRPGVVEAGESGLGGVTVELLPAAGGGATASTETAADGSFSFGGVRPGSYRAAIAASTFAAPYEGVNWLGPKLITPAVMIAYVWVWAGFAMVIIAAGR